MGVEGQVRAPDGVGIPGEVLAHIAEDQNRFAVGTLPGSEAEVLRQLEALAREVGVPSEAIVVRAAGPIEPTHLQTRTRPLLGGLQVLFQRLTTDEFFACTMIPVYRFGERYAMTSSHCTTAMGEVQSTPYWQAHHSETDSFIGFDAFDPPFPPSGSLPRAMGWSATSSGRSGAAPAGRSDT